MFLFAFALFLAPLLHSSRYFSSDMVFQRFYSSMGSLTALILYLHSMSSQDREARKRVRDCRFEMGCI